jgi:hypothetical protein
MRHRHLGAAATAAAIALSFPLAGAAQAGTSADPAHVRFRTAEQLEVIELSCAARASADGPVIRCRWSSPSTVLAVGVRLIRFDPVVDPYRTVALRTDDLSVTEYVDHDVRVGHRYGYAVQALAAGGRLVGRSRAQWVGVPSVDDGVEALRLACALGASGEATACEWSRPVHPAAAVVSLWRSVDGGARALVGQLRPSGPTSYRDPVPAGAHQVTYAVVVTSDGDDVVGQSRPETVRIPAPGVRPVRTRSVETRPTVTDRARTAP